MTKPKTEENISALDYLYEKLAWLGSKIETLSRGKISKKDLLIYSLIIIFILSVYFGGVLGGFTFILVLVTLWNTTITRGLLRRSKEAFKQSRIAFLVDIIDRTIDYIEGLPEHNKIAKETNYIINKARAIKRISAEVSVEFGEAMTDWTEGKLEKLNEEIRKYKKELEKTRKDWAEFLGWGK